MTGIPKTVEEWSKQVSESGLTGHVTMVSDNNGDRNIRQVDVGAGAVGDYHTKIPSDMVPHIHEVLRERDRMMDAALKVIIEIPNEELNSKHLAGMRQSCLLMAIDVIRKKYSTGENHGTTESGESDGRIGTGGGAEAPGTPAESAG